MASRNDLKTVPHSHMMSHDFHEGQGELFLLEVENG